MPGEEKRQRLIETALQVMYQQGTHRTTLADVAQASGVPLGNIYYYRDSAIPCMLLRPCQTPGNVSKRWWVSDAPAVTN